MDAEANIETAKARKARHRNLHDQPKNGSSTPLRQIRKTPLSGRFAYLAEREGFEPSIRLLTLYSLSRGAPSATRASLRVFSASLRKPARIATGTIEVKL
jgi:hypothetical protein